MSFVGSSWVYSSLAGVRRIVPSSAGSSGQRRESVFASKCWETRSASLTLPLSPLARHGQVPLPPALSGTQGSDTFFWPVSFTLGMGFAVLLGGDFVLLRSVKRWEVIYAHSKDVLNHPIFMASPPACFLLVLHLVFWVYKCSGGRECHSLLSWLQAAFRLAPVKHTEDTMSLEQELCPLLLLGREGRTG